LPLLLIVIDGALFAAIIWADPFGGMAMVGMIAVALPVSGIIHFLKRRARAPAA
jgi:hypothetical protein